VNAEARRDQYRRTTETLLGGWGIMKTDTIADSIKTFMGSLGAVVRNRQVPRKGRGNEVPNRTKGLIVLTRGAGAAPIRQRAFSARV
jgi:hypothetical protein